MLTGANRQTAHADAEGPASSVGASSISGAATRCDAVPSGACFHCGLPVLAGGLSRGEKAFCCNGCLTVFELLTENGLDQFYQLAPAAGQQMGRTSALDQFRYLDNPETLARLVDFSDGKTARVTLQIPAIHCIACVWLLENLFRLRPGITRSQVNFLRKEVSISFDLAKAPLSEVAALLASLGYEPELKLSALEKPVQSRALKRLYLQIGIAGFAFGNIMLYSLSSYLGLDSSTGPEFRRLMGYLSVALSIPVVTYSAADFWRTAYQSLRRRFLTIEVPIVLGLVAIFVQSCYEVFSGRGEGYFDSLTGLLFFLLGGRLFQQITYHRLAFNRDYKSFFPLSVVRRTRLGEERVALVELAVGNRLVLRHGDLIPADAIVMSGDALVDYSFVTGESDPVSRRSGDHLYAGGRQIGGVIEVEMVKAVSQSYLTSLWNQEAFRKDKGDTLDTMTNRYSQRFTFIIIAIALGSALYWSFVDPSRAVKAFTSVLIVACPCALALAAPFTLGTVQRWLARQGCFLRNVQTIEALAGVDAVVFDKTGTLTLAGGGTVTYRGASLSDEEELAVASLARQSNHPHAVRLSRLGSEALMHRVEGFAESTGRGIEGLVNGRFLWLGSAAWFASRGIAVPENVSSTPNTVHLALDGAYRGCYGMSNPLRAQAAELVSSLKGGFEVALVSGDQARERERFQAIFGSEAALHFNQSPQMKLEFVQAMQRRGRRVMMVGDGLNDAGALQQSDVGVAVVDSVGAFSPASDVILDSRSVGRIGELVAYARKGVSVVRLSFLVSTLYNIIGISIAARGQLSPITCAILMPLSSISVVAFASGLASWHARRGGWQELPPSASGGETGPMTSGLEVAS